MDLSLAIDRTRIERLLSKYIDALSEATGSTEFASARDVYKAHTTAASSLRARWRGGESLANLKADLQNELILYSSEDILGYEAELVGRAFGDLCRSVGIRKWFGNK